MKVRSVFLAVLVGLSLSAAAFVGYALRHGEIAAIEPPAAGRFDRRLVEEGRRLAGLGNCQVCHTRQNGRPFAGGRPMHTPFGTVYVTNITPDVETGIGSWSEPAFVRAMREGIDRRGRHLYPAFPYDYFTRTSDADLKAIYAFLMTREPVRSRAPENALSFPFNIRTLMAGWNLLFLRSGAWKDDSKKDAEWNRGAYLVEALGHCGACHSPRNVFGAAAKSGEQVFTGGHADGWYAPPLRGKGPGPIAWTQKALVNYLIDGWDPQHGIAAGPMTPVVDDLKDQREDDVFAIATYLMSNMPFGPAAGEQEKLAKAEADAAMRLEWGSPDGPAMPTDPRLRAGAELFEAQCAGCHKAGGKPVPLALTSTVNAVDPSNFIKITLHGVRPPRGVLDRSMPGRAAQLKDGDVAAVAAFVRHRFSKGPAWVGLESAIAAARASLD